MDTQDFHILDKPKVKDLITYLKSLPSEADILLSVDEEQNMIANKIAVLAYEGEVLLLPLNPQDI